jgi:hypothetical protein
MTIVIGLDRLMSMDARGAFGVSINVGRLRPGFNRLGFDSKYNGIYARKYTREGPATSRMVHMRPKNPRTQKQMFWRTIFAEGKSTYDTLTLDQKKRLSRDGGKQHMSGYNLFMSRWLQSRRGALLD